MNIFILNTGRCGSTSFIKACQHIANYTAAHESRVTTLGQERLAYPDQHIEADNRLSWLLGRLDLAYGDQAFYVHLVRAVEDTTASFSRRADFGIMKAYREGILMGGQEVQATNTVARDYIDTVESNIELFLRDKTRTMSFQLETAKADFSMFWDRIAAEGNLEQALAEWDIIHNAS
ncbi:MAG: hypothetical protein GXP22_03050 [Gammaproteobacteria bacterium]|nr:hypothetical protein [Gammaproteobacteria bacterium]